MMETQRIDNNGTEVWWEADLQAHVDTSSVRSKVVRLPVIY